MSDSMRQEKSSVTDVQARPSVCLISPDDGHVYESICHLIFFIVSIWNHTPMHGLRRAELCSVCAWNLSFVFLPLLRDDEET